MKKIQITRAIAVFLVLIFVSSCKTSSEVVSNGLIQKRKYTKGYYVNSHNNIKSNTKNALFQNMLKSQQL